MKKSISFAITLALILVVAITSVGFAEKGVNEPGVAGIFIDPIADIETTPGLLATGIEIPVGGYVQYISATAGGKNPKLTELLVEGQVWDGTDWVDVATIIDWDESPITNTLIRVDKQGRDFSDPEFGKSAWLVYATGTYRVYAYAKLTTGDGIDADEEFIVTLVSAEFTIGPMAAPAIASHILRWNEEPFLLRTGDGKLKTQTNLISEVADLLGPGACFNYGGECIEKTLDGVYANPAYVKAVKAYLEGRLVKTLEYPDYFFD